MGNETNEPPNKKLKMNKKSEVNVADDECNEESVVHIKKHKKHKKDKDLSLETSLNTNVTDECNEESVTSIKKHKKHKKDKDLSIEISLNTSITDECNEESVTHIKKHKKHKRNKDLSLDTNITDECNEEFVTHIKKHKKHKKDKDLSLEIKNSIHTNIKSEKSFLKNGCDFVKPLPENYVECTNFTSNNTLNQNNNKNVKVENTLNETQLPFHENKTKLSNENKYFDNKLEERTHYLNIKETVTLKSKGRCYTISIAVPASILRETCLNDILRTYVIGNLARAACIYSVDEIIVYNDQPLINNDSYFIGMMKMILEYQECPQYLRKDFFPVHNYLRYSGVLNVLNAPHHLLTNQWCEYREGIILPQTNENCSYAYVGFNSEILIDKKLEPGLRVTVKLPPKAKALNEIFGHVVSPDEPRIMRGTHWGYTVRVANCLSEVFKSDRFESGYDLIIGTSDKGKNVNMSSFQEFSHALILFGGVQGLEVAVEGDQSLSESNIWNLCHHYVNVCPGQSSKTIRTEEAVLITLATLCPKLKLKGYKGRK